MPKFSEIYFSRHARRRMKLYGISQEDVQDVLKNGEAQNMRDGKIAVVGEPQKKFNYPIKVISVYNGETLVIISAYPLKRSQKNENKLR